MGFGFSPPTEVGETIPANTEHAVSVTLPTWAANVAYEEGEAWVADKMTSGYPRFCIHFKIRELERWLEENYGRENESAMVFPSNGAAQRCREFIKRRQDTMAHPQIRVLQLATPKSAENGSAQAHVAVVFFPKELFPVAKQYWQHTGEGVSSRLAEYFLEQYTTANDAKDQSTYVEERFGRNLDVSRTEEAKGALRSRIAGHLCQHVDNVCADQIYLYPTGMTAINSAHRLSMAFNESDKNGLRSVCFGFPYTDTLKTLEKWGPGAIFYPRGTEQELNELESLLKSGTRIAALFCEFPSNPLLKSPNIVRISKMAKDHDFLVIVDDTVGNMSNISVLPWVDMTVSSLTKIFSGDCNVMAGALVLNHNGRHYTELKRIISAQFEDLFFALDALYLERNSRDFAQRSHRTNANAEAVVDLLRSRTDLVKEVYYPKGSDTQANYDQVKVSDGGYGGLLSVVFKNPEHASTFFDAINIAKGPSLGTNFTLACPYTIIAHFLELDFVESCGVDRNLVRISIGLEETKDLLERFERGLKACENS
ncbi:putative cystathionine gamma-synthase [Wickerhamiella sorbophila]|uniref:Putative cystathionine gamma-synthase n=1 Tax=Wickerhamiella sorbophila TaxID=45607 RepID=A0A2T0FI28_9ASCO|nr:putative cystathionine gamma-synthase [Wickerhamiella sorbophila]PRT54599.1 putative cystathionine gamma-synthase [Wickerhamiella sorbophila]